MKPKIGYIPIRYFNTDKPKVCEAPRHKDMKFPAFGVIAIQSDGYPDGLVQMVCEDCWNHFDDDMNHPNWNLMEYVMCANVTCRHHIDDHTLFDGCQVSKCSCEQFNRK